MAATHEDDILKLGNHREASRILHYFARGADLAWFDAATALPARRWFRLAQQHLRVARHFATNQRSWRVAVSRAYYAVYSASKSVRFFSKGRVGLDVADHKQVNDLPDDFPNVAIWSNFTTELRRDRNLADYDPWQHVRRSLTYEPTDAAQRAQEFLHECRHYLGTRGLVL